MARSGSEDGDDEFGDIESVDKYDDTCFYDVFDILRRFKRGEREASS